MAALADVPAYLLPGVPALQPQHLEGLTDSSLATEILPGPPSLVSIQQAAQRRDQKKANITVSFLPASDPGSTYSGLMAGSLNGPEIDGPRRKRARMDKSSNSGRAQRASARNLNSALPASDSTFPDEVVSASTQRIPDLEPLPLDAEEHTLSRANSTFDEGNTSFVSNGTSKSVRKDRGKGKEPEKGSFRVKEEHYAPSLSPEAAGGLFNEDHCSSCRSLGALVYCDSCPRAFHLWCLDPPMEAVDFADGERWFCPACTIRKNPPSKPPPSFMSPLIQLAQTGIPREFQLPDDIRAFFKDVSTGPRGGYVDSSEIKQPRLNRHGQLEDRDPYRLKDRNGVPVLCFRCGTSALPSFSLSLDSASQRERSSASTTQTTAPETWRSIVSCDHCDLHWHLDCLDPPLVSMPSFDKKWMCPNHADQVLRPKRRIPKNNIAPIDITKPNKFNNGNIDIVRSEPAPMTQRFAVDEVLINGRRYRVPEKIVMLDFWNKIGRSHVQYQETSASSSALSSPLTSLSSLDDTDEDAIVPDLPEPLSPTVLDVAQMLCGLRNASRRGRAAPVTNLNGPRRPMVDSSVQTEPEEKTIVTLFGGSTPKPRGVMKNKLASRPSLGGSSASINKVETTNLHFPTSDHPVFKRPKRGRPSKREIEDSRLIHEDETKYRHTYDRAKLMDSMNSQSTSTFQPKVQEAGGSQRVTRSHRKTRPTEKRREPGLYMPSSYIPIAPAPRPPVSGPSVSAAAANVASASAPLSATTSLTDSDQATGSSDIHPLGPPRLLSMSAKSNKASKSSTGHAAASASTSLPASSSAVKADPAATRSPSLVPSPGPAIISSPQQQINSTRSLTIRLPRLSTVVALSNSTSAASNAAPSSVPVNTVSLEQAPRSQEPRRRSARRHDSTPLSVSTTSSGTTPATESPAPDKPRHRLHSRTRGDPSPLRRSR